MKRRKLRPSIVTTFLMMIAAGMVGMVFIPRYEPYYPLIYTSVILFVLGVVAIHCAYEGGFLDE